MRIKVIFQDGLSERYHKVWCAIPKDIDKTEDLRKYLIKTFFVKGNQKCIVEMDGFEIPDLMDINELIKEDEVLTLKQKEKPKIEKKAVKGISSSESPSEKSKSSCEESLSSDDDLPKKKKRKFSNEKVQKIDNEDKGTNNIGTKVNLYKKKNDKQLKRIQKTNPKIEAYSGTHIKFNESGSKIYNPKISPELNIKTPAEEFEEKKSSWKIKPIPKRKPKFNVATQSILNTDGTPKQFIKRFGEINPELEIREIYEFDENDYELANINQIKEGDEILFKTLELNEETLTPAMSEVKRGKVASLEDGKVTIVLMREIDEEENKKIGELDIVDDLLMEKFQITIEKKWLVDVKIKKNNKVS
ncbi:unnamed protein product [Blepharisma stoltei]|uniref:Coilin n=1 Tax=Blepharisma stoltei TaxID=1481888 RepID=A0AAU9IEZ6_9CILI|nr:unnamed protein product [Blepharisma stoltei]